VNELIVLLPAYNEEENVSSLTSTWQSYREELLLNYNLRLAIVIINDGSGDQTKAIGEELERQFDNVTLVNHEQNKGLGQAIRTGIWHVLDCFPHAVATCLMDCDNTHHPKYVLDMLCKQTETSVDVVIASRYQKGARVKGVSTFRRFLSQGARLVYHVLLPVENVRDYTCGYRLYRNESLRQARERFGAHLVDESGFSCMAELLYKLYASGAVFGEVPFELRYDLKGGESKMNVRKTIINSMKLALRLRRIPKEKSMVSSDKVYAGKK
jgi:dolichol-phosphate mannosyltransferase